MWLPEAKELRIKTVIIILGHLCAAAVHMSRYHVIVATLLGMLTYFE